MEETAPVSRQLAPLDYHAEIVAYLKDNEPEVWAWARGLEAQEQHAKELRANLLRDTYRLSQGSHPEAYGAAAVAAERLGLTAPVTLYQASSPAMNAALMYLPGEIHVVFYGALLERLSSAELTALLGHELAHYKLWSDGDGEVYAAERILQQTLADPRAQASHLEPARLFSLYTELYADRGAAVAAQAPGPSIEVLVKVLSGVATADAETYLRQAEELEAVTPGASEGATHPEIFLRAQAVDRWWKDDAALDGWLRQRLRGRLDVARLDLLGQQAATRLTRGLLAAFLQRGALTGEAHLTQVRAYFPDWTEAEIPTDPRAASPERADDSLRRYLNSVMMDVALADLDTREDALVEALRISGEYSGLAALQESLRQDARMTKREVDALARRARKAAEA